MDVIGIILTVGAVLAFLVVLYVVMAIFAFKRATKIMADRARVFTEQDREFPKINLRSSRTTRDDLKARREQFGRRPF